MSTEKQLDIALRDALRDNNEFRLWFLSKTRSGTKYKDLVWSRANHPWGRIRIILPNPQAGYLEPVVKESETDVLAVFQDGSSKRLGLHIENKLSNGRFTAYQPDLYAARAEAWRNHKDYGMYDEWETVLVAPFSFVKQNKIEAGKFMSYISHEEIASFIPLFATKSDA